MLLGLADWNSMYILFHCTVAHSCLDGHSMAKGVAPCAFLCVCANDDVSLCCFPMVGIQLTYQCHAIVSVILTFLLGWCNWRTNA